MAGELLESSTSRASSSSGISSAEAAIAKMAEKTVAARIRVILGSEARIHDQHIFTPSEAIASA
jgi:hypothetical protein